MKGFVLKSFVVLTACLSLSAIAIAQATKNTPESVAKEYYAAVQKSDWEKCASLMHPQTLASLKGSFKKTFVDGKSSEVMQTVFGVKNSIEYAQLEDAVVYSRFMKFARREMSEKMQAGASGTTLKKADAPPATLKMLGTVKEGKDQAHVLYRLDAHPGGEYFYSIQVLSLQNDASRWRVIFPTEDEIALRITARFAMASLMISLDEKEPPLPSPPPLPKPTPTPKKP